MVLGNTFFLEINGFTYDIKRAPLNFLKNIGKIQAHNGKCKKNHATH